MNLAGMTLMQSLLRTSWGTGRENWLYDKWDYKLRSKMTAILAWKEKRNLCMAADGLSCRDGHEDYPYEYKTLRVNASIAIGIAGKPAWYPWRIFSGLFDIDVDESDARLHVVREIERLGLVRNDLSPADVCDYISTCPSLLADKAMEEAQYGLRVPRFCGSVVVAASVRNDVTLYGWDTVNGWPTRGIWAVKEIDLDRPVAIAPVDNLGLEVCREILMEEDVSPGQKAVRCLDEITTRTKFVNRNGTLRQSENGFRLELLYDPTSV